MNLREATVLRLGLDFAAYVRACIIGLICLTTTAYAENRSETIFFLNDALGSAVAAVNEDGELCWSEDYTPYGDKTVNDDVFSPPGSGCGIVGEERGYTGHTEDVNSDLVYMQQRYYDPSIGRFLSIDPLDTNPNDPRTYNRYAYAFNNPLKFIDSDGRHAADGIESQSGSARDQEIENGLRDGSGNMAPGYSASDSDDFRSRAGVRMDVYPALVSNGDIKGLLGIAVPFGNLKGLLVTKEAVKTSRAARREAMRKTNTPTSRSATEQSGSNGRRQYIVEGSDGKPRAVSQHPADKDHPKPHWHSSTPKTDPVTGDMLRNRHGQVKYKSGGPSVPYGD